MSENGLTQVKQKEIPTTIDEAFKVQEPDALVIVNPQPPEVPTTEEQTILGALGYEEKLNAEDLRNRKQGRIINKKLTEAMIDIAKWTVRATVGWFMLVGLVVVAYMVGAAFGVTLLPENALIALIGTVAIAAVVGGVSKVIIALGAKNSN